MPLLSMSHLGRARRKFMSGTSDCPPARTLASSSAYWFSSDTASSIEDGLRYSNWAGFISRSLRAESRCPLLLLDLAFDGFPQLADRHLSDSAEHPLPNAGNQAAHLRVGRPVDGRLAGTVLHEVERSFAADEPGRAVGVDAQLVVAGLLLVESLDLGRVGALDRRHANLHLRGVLVRPGLLERLHAGDALLQRLRVLERVPHQLTRRVEGVRTV